MPQNKEEMKGEGKSGQKRKTVRAAAVFSVVLAIVLFLGLFNYFIPFRSLLPAYKFPDLREGETRIHFLYVGQGDCSIVETEDEIVVIDAGDGSWSNDNKLIRYLKGLSGSSYTYIVTHADSDHYGGFITLTRVFGADMIYLPVLETSEGSYPDLLEEIEKAGCETDVLTRYHAVMLSNGAYFVCVSPYSYGETDENDSSTVLYFSCEGVNALFSGDISSEREERLLSEYAIDETLFDSGELSVRLSDTDILKVAHHGSKYSSSEEWISLLSPSVSVISSGQGNNYSHPTQETLARLSQSEIYRTDEVGDIVVSIYGGNYTVSTDYRL